MNQSLSLHASCLCDLAAPVVYAPCINELKEISILSEDEPPEGYIVNGTARKEMSRIAKAAHMQRDFAIYQPTFFGIETNVPTTLSTNDLGQTANFGKAPYVGMNDVPAFQSLNSSLSDSHVSSAYGSFRSVDSNISESSVHHNYPR